MSRNKGRQQGFTLIEIIAVLIILGILALIAIPKYQDIVDQAKQSSMDQAIAEGMARVNQAYATCLLESGGDTDVCNTLTGILGNTTLTINDLQDDVGDYELTIEDNGTCAVKITASMEDVDEDRVSSRPFCVE